VSTKSYRNLKNFVVNTAGNCKGQNK